MGPFPLRRLAPRELSPALQAFGPVGDSVWVEGPVPIGPVVALVGTRDATQAGVGFTKELARALGRRGILVASGGARGIDAAAHEGSLDDGHPTLAVLPTGPPRLYPAAHAALFARLRASGGTLVWPFEPRTAAHPSRFFLRNGVLVALSVAVVVVEAGAPSGSLNAAAWARRLGRPLYACAGPPWAEGLRGGTQLVAQGARIVRSTASLVEELSVLCAAPSLPFAAPADATLGDDAAGGTAPWEDGIPLDDDERAVAAACTAAPSYRDALLLTTGLSGSQLAAVILRLQLRGLLQELPSGQLAWAPGRRTA